MGKGSLLLPAGGEPGGPGGPDAMGPGAMTFLRRILGGDRDLLRRSALFWGTALVLTLLLHSRLPWGVSIPFPGDISPGDFRADRTLQVEDPLATEARRSEAAAAVAPVIDPATMQVDAAATAMRRREEAGRVPPAMVTVKKGEIVAREGDALTSLQVLKITAMSREEARDDRVASFIGMLLLTAVSLLAFYRVFAHMEPRLARDFTRLALLAAILVAQAALTRVGLLTAGALGARYGLPEAALAFAIPFAAAPMLAAPLFSTSVGILVAGASSFFNAAAHNWSLATFIFSFVAGAMVSFRVVHCQQRTALVKAGVVVGVVNVATAAVLALMAATGGAAAWAYQVAAAFAGGIGASLVASVALPVLEAATRVSTDMKLMELTNLNQPLLRQMIMVAPGTYHHSVMVGSLAEAAAEEIGANPVLARVAAYYHDIGKIGKPEYFVENQGGRANRHDKLTPNMSALILMSHVKDGMDLVRQHKLPEEVARIISEHHGTRLIKFFFNKAKEMEDPSMQTVDERDFRYPGPRPQTREAALIMLADQVEAAAKVLPDPTPARVRGVVQKIINDIFIDGQLDECDLALRDLHLIAKSFTRSLSGIYHHRIDYPEKPGANDEKKDKQRKKAKDPDADQDPESKTHEEPPQEPGGPGIKRLGQM